MPLENDVYAVTQFGDIRFPGETHEVDGNYRHHVHEYPHTPGGATEKLGRAVYRVTIRGNFQATFPKYPDLYPNSMNKLRVYYELGTTLNLTHPTIGTFPAFIIHWKQVRDARTLSGEKVDIEFLEDQEQQFALTNLALSADSVAIDISAQQLAADYAAARADLDISVSRPTQDVFNALQSAVNALLAIQDTRNLYGNLFVSRVEQVISLCQQLDTAMDFQDARAWPVVADLQQLWQNAIQIQNDLQQQRAQLQIYTVPFAMPLMQVAVNLYGDASRQSDLLGLNADVVTDPLRVPANTPIRYYPLTAQQTISAQAA